MLLTDLLTEEYIRINLPAKSKDDLIRQMIKITETSPFVLNIDEVERAVFEREQKVTTGIGNGLAMPHGRTDAVTSDVVAFAITEKPINFESIDDQPVRLVFFLVGRDQKLHLKLIGRISNIVRDDAVRQRLLNAKSSNEVFAIIRSAEESLPSLIK